MLIRNIGNRHQPYRGLTSEQVEINRQQHGANVLSHQERESWWKLYLEKFEDPVIRILAIAAIVALSAGAVKGEYTESIGIILAIILATTLAFVNEYKANQEFEILNQVYDDIQVRVIRDGIVTTIPRKEVVFGDLLYVEQGEEVPADGELIEAVSLLIDQSKITGESEPVQKYPNDSPEAQDALQGAYPIGNLYRGTLVDQGHGIFEVKAVGDSTEIGKLAIAVATVDSSGDTPLNLQLEKLSQLIGVVGLGVAGALFFALLLRGFLTGELNVTPQQGYFVALLIASVLVVLVPVWLPVLYDGLNLSGKEVDPPNWLEDSGLKGWLKTASAGCVLFALGIGVAQPLNLLPDSGQPWLPGEVGTALLQYFMVAVTIIVVAVPEGLPMSVTLSLAYSMRKMAASNNLVRRMHACETIGAATVICSDKTGTLTQNQMRVSEADFPSLQAKDPSDVAFAEALIAEAIAANSTADLERKPQEEHRVLGNVTEGALLLWLEGREFDYLPYRNNFQFTYQTSFSTEKKYMSTLGTSGVTEKDVIHVKGAPEIVLSYCSHILTPNGEMPLEERETILAELKAFQQKGMRTLALAYEQLPNNLMQEEFQGLRHNLTWLGFVAIADPLRKEVPQAIQTCLKAGINIKVVTGDCAETALEIARQLGLWNPGDNEISPYTHLTGRNFRALDDEEASVAVRSLKVLSRAIPLDKLRLVQLLQNSGEVVAVTGDGTNDAAALKQARVGLAMGSGTAIAKEASDIILLDDSFQSIINAMIWGRSLYKNIQRFILFQLTINVAALGIALLGPFLGVALPLTVTQMLWVNLIMDTFAALALAAEPPQNEVIEEKPRNPSAFIISPSMVKNILAGGLSFLVFLIGFLLYLRQDDQMSLRELSIFFAVFVLLQFWNLFNARCLGSNQSAFKGILQNKGFLLVAATILLGQVAIVQFGGSVFRTVPLPGRDWLIIIASTSVVLWFGEIWRWFGRRTSNIN
ncbi:calcium-translocating P-type ATPase, PMCA-type [Lusitaniella coriacea LEGE 07157]|uniref:P-type Ca(2+) transporter n=1 Tax=Lusitaniella coriacea LEGE 07157 TaxID=945747 RepID=A0A8J7E1Z0_9CYAN|nr:calcium-translocating P-type ATPase, PMCA-type [Lusitaniella coriacea]MBE9118878.1 calcium-translocating P-type ATPase, PMCA-type [Lusitaniella coriacea LEGE 07157]